MPSRADARCRPVGRLLAWTLGSFSATVLCVCPCAEAGALRPLVLLCRGPAGPLSDLEFKCHCSLCLSLCAQAGALRCLVQLCRGPEGPLPDLEGSEEAREEAAEAARLAAKKVSHGRCAPWQVKRFTLLFDIHAVQRCWVCCICSP